MKSRAVRTCHMLSGGDDMADALYIVDDLLSQSNGPRGRRGLFSQLGVLTRCEEVGGGDYGPERLHGPSQATSAEVKGAVEQDYRFEKPPRGTGGNPGPVTAGTGAPASLSPGAVAAIMAMGEWPQEAVPELKGASEWLTARPDGSLIEQSGYDPTTGVYVRMDTAAVQGAKLVEESPPASHVERALYLLQVELLGDFEWESPADAANALAAVISGTTRYAFKGTMPLMLLDATMAMSGKGTLAAVIQKMAGVMEPDVRGFPKDDDELGKSIMSTLRSSANAVIVWDNVERAVEGEDLAALLTSRTFKKRLLRGNDDFVGLNDRMWCVTGNNIRLGKDIRRRSVRVRQKPTHDPREGKRKFRHPDLFGWMDENKAQLVWAVGTLVRAWASSGRPEFSDSVTREKMASYKGWVDVVGGILETVGVHDFLANVPELQFEDDATSERADMIEAIMALKGGGRFTAQELAQAFNDAAPDVQDALPTWLRGRGGVLVNVSRRNMEIWLKSSRDQMAGLPGELHVTQAGTVGKGGRTSAWRVAGNVAPETDSSSVAGAAAAFLSSQL